MSSNQALIEVRGLGKVYPGKRFRRGFRALENVDLEVGRGAVFGLLGPNGAGKTTLIKILLGLVRRFEGQAALFGEHAGTAKSRTRVGYLPEAHRLPNYLTGWQVLELFGQMCGRDRTFLRKKIPELLELVDMRKDARRKLREYSKGMQQRIGLAQAMVHEPELIFLDEPTDGVDPIGRAAIREAVVELKNKGVTIFINSHLLMEVEMICDRVVIMNKGKILREGTIEELTPQTGVMQFEIDPIPDDLEQMITGLCRTFARTEKGFEAQLDQPEMDQLIDRLRAKNVSLRSLSQRRLTLEQAFIGLVEEEIARNDQNGGSAR